ncbi:hypothetical protein ZWY2020_035949 [Hordeum vulgare]|nr:hypothetical protein ZWY2020_035949 [Hordeum vulgare]
MVPACARQKADHPERSQMEIVQQFWSDAGFPTPARRSSEAVSPANSGKCTDGVHVCRDSKKAELRSRRRLSSSAGVRLKKMPPRMGPWRGPLPPRRISPLPVLGVLIDSLMETRSSSAPQKTTPTAIGVAETMQAAPPFAPGSVESSNRNFGYIPVHRLLASHPQPYRPCRRCTARDFASASTAPPRRSARIPRLDSSAIVSLVVAFFRCSCSQATSASDGRGASAATPPTRSSCQDGCTAAPTTTSTAASP